jgi:hypothetical protein
MQMASALHGRQCRCLGVQVQKAAEAALKHLSSQSNSLFPYKLQEVRIQHCRQPRPLTVSCPLPCRVTHLSVTHQALSLLAAKGLIASKQVEKASSRVHGGGTEFQLTIKAAQGDMPATTIEVRHVISTAQ